MPEVFKIDLSRQRRSLMGYSAGMAAYALVVVAMYPAFKNSTSLDNLIRSDSTAAALFGITGSISSSSGWLNGNLYANFYPLVMLLLTIGYGASCIAGQDEDGTLGLVATLPVRRAAMVAQKAAAMALQATALALALGVCVAVGRFFDLKTSIVAALSLSCAVALLGLDLGFVTMAIGALTGKRGTALGLGSAVAGASYLVSSLAPVVSWLRPARYVSVFYWAIGNGHASGGVSGVDYAVLIGVGAVGLAVAGAAFGRLDLH